MLVTRCFRALLISTALLLAVPTLAGAATYTVNNPFDEPSGHGTSCGDGEECSLRAAIELSNEPTNRDTILFGPDFEGGSDDTIQPGPGFPEITDEVTIDGDGEGHSQCDTAAGVEGPCVGIESALGLDVLADKVTIEGLAVTGSDIAIDVRADEFSAQGNWIGTTLESSSSETTIGILLGPGSDKATIGGSGANARNVFAYSGVGLTLRGASETTVSGNYFGLDPDGTTEAGNDVDLVVADKVDTPNVEATHNTIGADVGSEGLATEACDFGCNVFASPSAMAGVDLLGGGGEEVRPTGPTRIAGNYVGLDATGAPLANGANVGIRVGTAPDTTIGGKNPGQANRLHGSGYAIASGNGGLPAKRLVVEGNSIGRSFDGADELSPPFRGMEIASDAIAVEGERARLIRNQVSATGVGILQHGVGAVIEGNEVSGGEVGIETLGATKASGIGNLIVGNEVRDSEDGGIMLRNDLNQVFGNEVFGAGEAGIEVAPTAEVNVGGNVIGGDSDAEENAIFGSANAAIEIFGIEESRNEVRRNRGSENGATFIRLRSVGASEPGNGVDPPKISAVGKIEATGTSKPGAVVRVFRKASAEEGEVAGFLGQATANGSGEWNVVYAAQPEGTLVTATQTLDGGTSELSATAKTPPDPPSGCPAVPAQCPPPPPAPPAPDVTPPTVTIKKGPKAKSTSSTAKFEFTANEAGSTFQCKLDGKAFATCRSPKTYKKLKPGKHVFKVKATDAAGNVGVVLTRKFTVLG